MDEKTPYHYVLVRADLPCEVQSVMTDHASGESAKGPLPVSTVLVRLHVADEAELLSYDEKIRSKGFATVVIREPDAPYLGQAMAIGVVPTTNRNKMGKVVYHLKKACCPNAR